MFDLGSSDWITSTMGPPSLQAEGEGHQTAPSPETHPLLPYSWAGHVLDPWQGKVKGHVEPEQNWQEIRNTGRLLKRIKLNWFD